MDFGFSPIEELILWEELAYHEAPAAAAFFPSRLLPASDEAGDQDAAWR